MVIVGLERLTALSLPAGIITDLMKGDRRINEWEMDHGK